MRVNLFINNDGFKINKDGPEVLNHFLMGELSFSVSIVNEICEGVELIENMSLYEWIWSGNAHELHVRRDNVDIINSFVEEYKVSIPFNDFKEVILSFKNIT